MGFIYSCSVNIADSQSSYFQVETNGKLVFQEGSYESDGYPIYIIEDSNIYVKFFMESDGIQDCYMEDGNGTASFKIGNQGGESPQSSTYNTDTDITEVIFYKDLGSTESDTRVDYRLPLSANAEFSYEGSSINYGFNFQEDIDAPSIDKFEFASSNSYVFLNYENTNEYLIKKDTNYGFEYQTQDLESGIESVSFSNIDADNIERDLEEISSDPTATFSGTIEDSFSSDTTISIISQDLLDNSNTSEIVLKVDDLAPEMMEGLSTFDINYYPNEQESRIEFEIVFQDQTYEILNIDEISLENLKLNISQLNPVEVADVISPNSCIKDTEESDRIICYYNQIIETFKEESIKTISFTTTDSFENTDTESLNLNVDTDLEPPILLDFYVENNIGEQDWISSSSSYEPQDSIIFLKFRDEEINSQTDIIDNKTVIADFNELKSGFGENGSCFYVEGNVECTWILVSEDENNIRQELSNKNDEELELTVLVTDTNLNVAEFTINVSVDNIFPEIIELNFTFSDEVFGTVQNLQTGLSPIFRLYLNDSDFDNESNLEEDVVKDLVFVDFSEVSNEDDYINPEECSYDIDENYWVCEFKEITITSEDNGRAFIKVYDKAGNLATENKELQVYGTIEDYEVLKYDPKVDLFNSVDRNLAYSTDFKVLYKVTLENESDKSFRLLYANMLPDTCSWLNRSEILELDGVITAEDLEDIDIVEDDYFSITDERYPRMIGLGYHLVEDDGGFDDSEHRDFYVEFEFLKHENFADLINNGIRCNISIVKRDNLDIYGPEIHELNFLVGFTGELENTIIYNKAEKLLGEIEDNRALALNTQTLREVL